HRAGLRIADLGDGGSREPPSRRSGSSSPGGRQHTVAGQRRVLTALPLPRRSAARACRYALGGPELLDRRWERRGPPPVWVADLVSVARGRRGAGARPDQKAYSSSAISSASVPATIPRVAVSSGSSLCAHHLAAAILPA